jgi:hypothetical protein
MIDKTKTADIKKRKGEFSLIKLLVFNLSLLKNNIEFLTDIKDKLKYFENCGFLIAFIEMQEENFQPILSQLELKKPIIANQKEIFYDHTWKEKVKNNLTVYNIIKQIKDTMHIHFHQIVEVGFEKGNGKSLSESYYSICIDNPIIEHINHALIEINKIKNYSFQCANCQNEDLDVWSIENKKEVVVECKNCTFTSYMQGNVIEI